MEKMNSCIVSFALSIIHYQNLFSFVELLVLPKISHAVRTYQAVVVSVM